MCIVNLQINPRTWPNLKVGDILEISASPSSNANQMGNQLNCSLNRGCPSASANPTNATNQSTSNGCEDEISPILLQVVNGSFSDSILVDSIRVDSVANYPPFSFKAISYVNVTVVDKWVFHSFLFIRFN